MADTTPPVGKPGARLLQRHMLRTGVLCIAPRADARTLFAACTDGVYELGLETGERKPLYTHESYASGLALFSFYWGPNPAAENALARSARPVPQMRRP